MSYGYQANNVQDELGWITDIAGMNRDLKVFYDKTGVQPYIYLAANMGDMVGDETSQQIFCEGLYGSWCPNEACVLLVYFDTGVPGVDGDCYLTYGKEAGAIFDDEAMNIFWGYLDQYWNDMSLSEQELFVKTFDSTAKRIMSKTSTGMDVLKWVAIGGVIIIIAAAVLIIMKTRRAHERERNQETADILNADLKDLVDDDDLLNKYDE